MGAAGILLPAQAIAVTPAISGGYWHTVGLEANGNVVAAGYNGYGQCDVSGWNNIVAVSAGSWYTVGLKSDGTAMATDDYGHDQPQVSGWSNIVAVSAGSVHAVGLKADGSVVATGDDSYGKCDVSGWSNMIAVSAGRMHTVGLKADGCVLATGDDGAGQCNVSAWNNIVTVSAGDWHTVGLKADGSVVATGFNTSGQCDVSDWSNIVAVSAGGHHTVGLRANGTVAATGDNSHGQCNVSGWTNIVAVSAGSCTTVGLKSDGTVLATGDNTHGECNVSGWTLLPPTAPSVTASIAVQDGPAYRMTWPAVGNAASYEWRVDGDGTTSNTSAFADLTLVPGAQTFEVRAINSAGASTWATTTIVYQPPITGAPAASTAYSHVKVNAATVTWAAVGNAAYYEAQLNGGAVTSTTVLSSDLSGQLIPGTNTFLVRAGNPVGVSAWATVTVTYVPTTMTRLGSSDMYAESIAVSRSTWTTSSSVVVANVSAWPDAIAASALGAPLFFSSGTTLDSRVSAEIARLGASKVYIVGSTKVVSDAVETALGRVPGVTKVKRLGGADRYGTAVLIADEVRTTGGTIAGNTAIIAYSQNYPDALSGAPIAFAKHYPVLLSAGTTLNSQTKAELTRLGITNTLVLGSTTVVPDSVKKVLPSPTRLSGGDRWGTSDAIASYAVTHGMSAANLALASGRTSQDGLLGGMVMGQRNGVLCLVPGDMSSQAREFVTNNRMGVVNGFVFGTTSRVTSAAYDEMNGLAEQGY